MKIAAMDIFFAVTTVVTIITDVVAAANGKMGGLDVFMFVMEDQWPDGSSDKDDKKKFAFIQCLNESVFDFGSDNRQSRFGLACAVALIDVAHFKPTDNFFNFGQAVPTDKLCRGEYRYDYANNMRLMLESAQERFFGGKPSNPPRADVSLVSIVVAGNAVKEPVKSNKSSDFYADGNLQFIVTLAGPLTGSGGDVTDFRIVPFDGSCTSEFVDKFQRAICKPKPERADVFNTTECVPIPGEDDKCRTATIYKPEIKGADTICQKHLHVTYENCTCPTTVTTTTETTTTTTVVPSTESSSTGLIVGVVIGVIIVLIVVGIVVAIVVMKRRRGSEQPAPKSQAPPSAHTRSVLAKVQSQKNESQMSKSQSQKSKKTQQETPKSQMSKSQVPQKTSQMSKTQSSKVKTGQSQMGKGSKMSPK